MSAAALQYLHSILDSHSAKDKPTVNKLRKAFAIIDPIRRGLMEKGKEIREDHHEIREDKDANGNLVRKEVIPMEKKDAYDKLMEELHDSTVTPEFDVELHSFVRMVVETMLDRPELAAGLQDERQVKYYGELCDVFEIDMDTEPHKDGEGDEGPENRDEEVEQ